MAWKRRETKSSGHGNDTFYDHERARGPFDAIHVPAF